MPELKDLQQKIPFKWKIQTINQNTKKAQCVAYIDARDVMDLLDKVVGAKNWQDKYEIMGNQIMCGIGIRSGWITGDNTDTEWVWKWDTGVAGNFETEKSAVSDAFKRAAVKWGVGRFLYDLDFEWVLTDGKYPIREDNLEKIWDLTKHINSKAKYANTNK